MLRVLHTADWHLGHTLHDRPQTYEHDRFLSWLLELLEAEAVDALIVAGDVFDSANPPADAVARWYDFLATARGRLPALDVVVVGGNHDSAARLEAPRPLLGARIHVVGGLPRRADDRGRSLGPDYDALLRPLHNAEGQVVAWVAAVPYLRPSELPRVEEGADPLVGGVARIYRGALEALRARREPGQALLATGHCYMSGGRLSELSERRILGGHQHALPVDLFDPALAYVALGHLHLAQTVGDRPSVCYSGSPIPLSMGEAAYPHQVRLVELAGERFVQARSIPVPRAVQLLRLPVAGPAPLSEVLAELACLPPLAEQELAGEPEASRPLLEVSVCLAGPEPQLRQQIEAALQGKLPRLVRLVTRLPPGSGHALADAEAARPLRDLGPREVLERRWARDHPEALPADLAAAFDQLLEALEREEGPP